MSSMKLFKWTALGVGLLVVALIADLKLKSSKSEIAQVEKNLIRMDIDQISKMTFRNSETEIELVRDMNGWSLSSPIKAEADNEFVSDFLSELASQKALEIAKEGADLDLKVFGLDRPSMTLSFVNSLGVKTDIAISNLANFEGNYFARINQEDKIWVVPSTWYSQTQKSANDFRDLRLFRKKMAAIKSVHIKNDKGQFTLQDSDAGWTVNQSNDQKIWDQNKIRQFIKSIADAKGREYIIEGGDSLIEKSKLKKYGFDKPKASIELDLGETKWKADIAQDADFKIYARIQDPQAVLWLESGAVDDVLRFTDNNFKVEYKK